MSAVYSPIPVPRPRGRRPTTDIVTRCNIVLKVTNPDTHLKTKTHWVLGWIPPEDDGGHRDFYASWKWEIRAKGERPYTRYWGYAEFDGRRNYGWIDHGTYHETQRKIPQGKRPKPYALYRAEIDRKMKLAWRYPPNPNGDKKHPLNKRPVRALLPSPADETELEVYRNPWEGGATPETPDPRLRRNSEAGGFLFAVRWATDGWILINASDDNEDWVFIKVPPERLDFKNVTVEKNGERIPLKRKYIEMNRAEIRKYAKNLQGGP